MKIGKILLSFSVCAATVFAAEGFISDNTKLFNKAGGEQIGDLKLGAKVEILKTQDKFSQISLKGWSAKGAEDTLYLKDGVILELATLNEVGLKITKQISTKKDEYGSEWVESSIEGYVAGDAIAPSLDKKWGELRTLYSQRCSSCHALHEISHFDANTWPSLLDAMAERAGMSPTEQKSVLKFLQYETIKQQH